MECHQSQPRNFLGRGDLCLPNDRSGTIGTSFGLLGILCARTQHEEDRHLHSQHTHQDAKGHTKHKTFATLNHGQDTRANRTRHTTRHLAHVTHSLHSNAREHATRTALTDTEDGSESPYPGANPGLNPCNHLTWLVGGPWRTHIQAWYGMVWYGMAWDWTGLLLVCRGEVIIRSSSS